MDDRAQGSQRHPEFQRKDMKKKNGKTHRDIQNIPFPVGCMATLHAPCISNLKLLSRNFHSIQSFLLLGTFQEVSSC